MHRHTHNIKPAEWLPTAGKPHGICKWDAREVWVHSSHANVMETSKTEVINRLAACCCLHEHHVALKATHMTHSLANVHTSGHMKGRFGVHTSECSKRHVTQLNRGLWRPSAQILYCVQFVQNRHILLFFCITESPLKKRRIFGKKRHKMSLWEFLK